MKITDCRIGSHLVVYNVACPADHIAFFSLVESDMEGVNCNGRYITQLQAKAVSDLSPLTIECPTINLQVC